MSIRHKILISNIILVCVPVLLAGLLWLGYTHLSESTVVNPLRNVSESEGSLSHTQEALYFYEAELAKIDWKNIENAPQTDEDIIPRKDAQILSELSDMGYHFQVSNGESIIFDNLTESDSALLDGIRSPDSAASGSLLHFGNITVIRDTFYGDHISYIITAVFDETAADTGTIRSMLPVYMLSPTAIIIFLLIVIGATVLTGFILSRWIGHSILEPLDVIRGGAKQIADGNLDFHMDMVSSDEFSEVRDEFEIMRGKLKSAENDRITYEKKRKELLSGISHDLRSPLTSIKGYCLGLKDGIANTDEKKNRYYDAILTRSNDMERLLGSLSELVRLENAKEHIHPELLQVDAFLLQFIKEQESLLKENHVTVRFDSNLDGCKADIDADEMRRVFSNLLENTMKYRTDTESNVRIEAVADQPSGELHILFSDDGPGVPEETLSYLFDSFYRVDDSRTKPENGSGLGLAIVKEIIEGHGGRVEAYLAEGLGIRIILPLKKEG